MSYSADIGQFAKRAKTMGLAHCLAKLVSVDPSLGTLGRLSSKQAFRAMETFARFLTLGIERLHLNDAASLH